MDSVAVAVDSVARGVAVVMAVVVGAVVVMRMVVVVVVVVMTTSSPIHWKIELVVEERADTEVSGMVVMASVVGLVKGEGRWDGGEKEVVEDSDCQSHKHCTVVHPIATNSTIPCALNRECLTDSLLKCASM